MSTGEQSIINHYESEDPEFDNVANSLKNKNYAETVICRGQVGSEFVSNAIDHAAFLFTNTYLGDIIGFASVKFYEDEENPPNNYFYIELICNSAPHGYPTSSSRNIRRLGGKAMIQEIERVAREHDCKYIELKAIDDVISYYYKLGFNFKNVELSDYLKTKQDRLINELRSNQSEEDEEKTEQSLNQIIKRFYPGYLSEMTQRKLGETEGSRIAPMQETGITMIKYLTARGGKKTKSVPKRYIPKSLNKKDKKTQKNMLKKSRKLYKKGKYFTRKKVKSFKSKTSNHITNAKKIYKVKKVYPSKNLSRKTGCSMKGLQKIAKKGQGAYFSSGSRPNQTAQSWGNARLASSITGGKAAAVDFNIIEKYCKKNGKAYKLGVKSRKKYGYGNKKTPQTNL